MMGRSKKCKDLGKTVASRGKGKSQAPTVEAVLAYSSKRKKRTSCAQGSEKRLKAKKLGQVMQDLVGT